MTAMTDIINWLREGDEPLLDDYREVCAKYSQSQPNRLLEAADEIVALQSARNECERQFQEQVAEVSRLLCQLEVVKGIARDEALEEAAQMCFRANPASNPNAMGHAIRALKDKRKIFDAAHRCGKCGSPDRALCPEPYEQWCGWEWTHD